MAAGFINVVGFMLLYIISYLSARIRVSILKRLSK
jgi:hypothetical protein